MLEFENAGIETLDARSLGIHCHDCRVLDNPLYKWMDELREVSDFSHVFRRKGNDDQEVQTLEILQLPRFVQYLHDFEGHEMKPPAQIIPFVGGFNPFRDGELKVLNGAELRKRTAMHEMVEVVFFLEVEDTCTVIEVTPFLV